MSGRARLGRVGLAINVPGESNLNEGRSPKAVELPQVRRMLNDLHKLEHELRTALCSCKKELHKRSARCPLMRDPTPSRRNLAWGLICSNATRRKYDASSSLRATRPVSSVLLTFIDENPK